MKWNPFRRKGKPISSVKVVASSSTPSQILYFEVSVSAPENYAELLGAAQAAIGTGETTPKRAKPSGVG
ncbi:MAG: hypothetical protein ABSB53_05110 [Nitrososphaerales archaeon]|jgi:hypothetical protein